MVKMERDGAVTVLRMVSPQTKNALDLDMAQALTDALAIVQADTDCRVFVLTGSGRAFSCGPDLKGLLQLLDQPDGLELLDQIVTLLNRFILSVFTSTKLSVAALNGYAFGGGLNITLPFDYRLAVERAVFVENFYHMGITPDLSASFFLPRLIGPARALAALWTGQMVSAPEAAAWGLIHEVVASRSDLEQRMMAVARTMAEGAAEVVTTTRNLLQPQGAGALCEQLELEKAHLLAAFRNTAVVRPRLERLLGSGGP